MRELHAGATRIQLLVLVNSWYTLQELIRYLRCWCDSSEAVEMILAHCQWCNIILCWFPDNTAGIVTRRSGFQRRLQDAYVLPVVVEDSGYPAQSSTSTLTIRVCSCEAGGSLLTCSAEAIFLPVGLSTGALMAIFLCVALLIGKHIFLLSSCFFYNSERNIKTVYKVFIWHVLACTGSLSDSVLWFISISLGWQWQVIVKPKTKCCVCIRAKFA